MVTGIITGNVLSIVPFVARNSVFNKVKIIVWNPNHAWVLVQIVSRDKQDTVCTMVGKPADLVELSKFHAITIVQNV